jgi:signal transduction histidine kinase
MDFPDVHIILTHQSASAATAVLQGIQKSQKYQGRIIGAWESGSDVGGLNAILAGQSALSRALTSGPAIPPSPQDAAAEDHSLAEDVRLAFEPLVEAAEYKSRPCAALLFKIHRQHHQVHLVASCGDDKLIKGFRQYLQRLHRSPVRDLAIYRLQSNTDSAKDNEGRYIYFLDAVGGPEQDLSVRGIRPATPDDSPFAFAAFLVSPRKDAFRGNPHLSKKLLGATQRAIEVALATDVYRTRLQRLKEAAERAADFQYMAHEAAGALEQPVDILKRLTGDFVVNPDDIGALRRGTLRASAVMKQMLPREQTESASFSPGAVIDDLLQECKAVERDASGIVLKFDGHTLKGARVYGRRLAFECVLRNIVLNALQQIREYCGGKGNVRLQAAFHDEKTGEKLLIVTVSDDGPGIHRSYWEAIFQGGASTRTHGTGLGLVLSRRLVAQAKGTLELTDSCVYSGSTFRIKMPIAEEAEGQSS